jgi:hypothetical protein
MHLVASDSLAEVNPWFDFSPEVNDGESSDAECREGAVLA